MEEVYTTHQVARFCRVQPVTIIRWIESGKLKAYKTPGGHRRVERKDLIAFLESYQMPIPAELAGELRKKVLVVSDAADTVAAVKEALGADDDLVLATVSTGFEAGVKVAGWQPDLVILDFGAPGIDSGQVAGLLKGAAEDTPLIGLGSDEDAEKIEAAGAASHVKTPIKARDLVSAVRKHLGLPVRR